MRLIRLLVFCLFVTGASRAQAPFMKEFWLNESNTAVRVNDLISAGSGYLWLGTDNGLCRFNGRSFTWIRDSIRQPVTAVTEAGGIIYVGYADGRIGVVSNNAIVQVKIRNRFPASTITSLHARGSFLYVTTEDEGIFLIMNNTGFRLTSDEGLTDNFIYDAMIAPDELMVATDRGVNHIKWDGKKPVVEVFTTARGLPDNIVRVLRPISGTKLCWIGTQEGGLALYNDRNETFRGFKMSHPWAWGQVNDILPLGNDEAWIATEEGYLLHAVRYDDSLDVQPFTYEGLKLRKLVRDRAGNIWCATNRGLMMSTALFAVNIRFPQAYSLGSVTALACDRHNNLWFTQNDALYRVPVDHAATPELVLKTDASITCLFSGPESDELWIGTFGKGLFCYTGGKLIPARNIEEIIDGHILSVAGIGNRLWIASLSGVEETVVRAPFDGSLKVLKRHNKVSGTGSDYVYQLYPDSKGRMWMATDGGGVCMFDGRNYHRWDTTSGLKSEVVYCIAEDAEGSIWAGTLEKGLFVYKGDRWEQIGQEQGLQDMNIAALRGTATGEMVVVNEDGIDEWYPQNRQFRHYNRRLGVEIDSTLNIPNCIAGDTNGNVYVPFEHGLVVFRNQDKKYDINPRVHINAVSLFFRPVDIGQREFAYNENHISFRYDGINFSNPERLHYRYKLEGYEDNWIYTSDEVIPFAQLPPGEYVFRVQASLNSGFGGAAEDSYAFMVVTPFWQRTWFILIVVLFLLGTGYGYIRVREKGLRNMSRLQKERMVFEYEHLKSQVNPHFLFNSLNTLVSLIEDNREAAVDYTVHLSDLYRNMLSYKDQDLISLEEEYGIITNYMYIQKSRFGEALQLHTEIPEHLLKTKRIVPLALQLLVENAIKHNVVSLSKPLTISIIANEQEIMIRNPLQPKMSREKGAGLGLVNIRKRYSLLTSRNTKFGIEDNEYIVILPLL